MAEKENTDRLRGELKDLIEKLLETGSLDPSVRYALEQFDDISEWDIVLPSEEDIEDIFEDIARVKADLETRRYVLTAIGEGIKLLQKFLPL